MPKKIAPHEQLINAVQRCTEQEGCIWTLGLLTLMVGIVQKQLEEDKLHWEAGNE